MAKKKSGAHNPTTPGNADSVRGNLAGLIDQVKASNALLESGDSYAMTQTYALSNINNVIMDVAADVKSIATLMTGNALKQKEADAEAAARWEDIANALKKKDQKAPEKKEGSFSWLGLAAALITGLVAGGMAFIAKYIKGLQALWTGIAKALKIDGVIVKLFNLVKSGFTFIENLVSTSFSKIAAFVSKIFDNKMFASIANFFNKIVTGFAKLTGLSGIMDEFAELWKSAKAIFGMIFGPESSMAKFFKFFSGGGGGFIGYFDDLLKFFTPITSFFKALGSVLGKLALPIQVIMSIWDTVSGALDGWNKTEGDFMAKFFGAIKGGLTGLLNGLIGGLLDLLKDGLSWILEALGFDKAAKILDSFSFTGLIEQLVGGFFNMVESIVRWTVDLFKNGPTKAIEALADVVSNIADAAKNVMKSLLRMVLPNPSGGFAAKLAAKAVPDSVYEFAGMDPKTGALQDEKPAAPAAEPAQITPKQATVLPQAQAENTSYKQEQEMSRADANVQKMALGLRPSFDRARPEGGKYSGGGVVPLTSQTTKWDPEDAMARGAR